MFSNFSIDSDAMNKHIHYTCIFRIAFAMPEVTDKTLTRCKIIAEKMIRLYDEVTDVEGGHKATESRIHYHAHQNTLFNSFHKCWRSRQHTKTINNHIRAVIQAKPTSPLRHKRKTKIKRNRHSVRFELPAVCLCI